ncbi:MAG: hypothetical protein JWR39_2150 [Devosia sp.]|nr:hypothetical protein [Devosia sp.]
MEEEGVRLLLAHGASGVEGRATASMEGSGPSLRTSRTWDKSLKLKIGVDIGSRGP